MARLKQNTKQLYKSESHSEIKLLHKYTKEKEIKNLFCQHQYWNAGLFTRSGDSTLPLTHLCERKNSVMLLVQGSGVSKGILSLQFLYDFLVFLFS